MRPFRPLRVMAVATAFAVTSLATSLSAATLNFSLFQEVYDPATASITRVSYGTGRIETDDPVVGSLARVTSFSFTLNTPERGTQILSDTDDPSIVLARPALPSDPYYSESADLFVDMSTNLFRGRGEDTQDVLGQLAIIRQVTIDFTPSGQLEQTSGPGIFLGLNHLVTNQPDDDGAAFLTTFAWDTTANAVVFDAPQATLLKYEISPIPLPATGLLLLTGLGGMTLLRRRTKPA